MNQQNGIEYNPSQPNLSNPRTYSPYGITFDDEKEYRRRQQQKYKEDLDYLCSLRKKGNMKDQSEIEEELRRMKLMDDVTY